MTKKHKTAKHAQSASVANLEHWFRQALALQQAGRWLDAVQIYRRILQAAPQHAETLHQLSICLFQAGQHIEAIKTARQALGPVPNNANHAMVLAGMYGLLEDMANAERYARIALGIKPDYAEAHYNLGLALEKQGRIDEAGAAYRGALRNHPAYPEAHYNLGLLLKKQGRFDEAIAAYRQAIQFNPAYQDAYYNLGIALQAQRRYPEAIEAFRGALRLGLDWGTVAQLFHTLQHICDWAEWARLGTLLKQGIANGQPGDVPSFILLTLPASLVEQQMCARQWTAKHIEPLARAAPAFSRGSRAKLRIGYLSADLRRHPVAYLTAALFELHDRGRFEIIAYSYGVDDRSEMRARLQAGFDRFVDIRELSFAGAAERIRADGIDILVDLTGYTQDSRSEILAFRPAPIQVSFLGYPGTCGSSWVDYLIADPFLLPEYSTAFYDEKIVWLPDTYMPSDCKRGLGVPPSRSAEGLPDSGMIFCCFNQPYKITPEMFGIWMRILDTVPGSVLWLTEANPWASANLRREAQMRGVAPERLIFASHKALIADHLARLALADVFLDTLPYNAHTTLNDALWAGVPAVTCAGEAFAARVGGSLLRAVGLTELVTGTLQEYENLILELARNPGYLAEIRAKLAVNREHSPLFDTPRFARHLELAYEAVWARFEQGLGAGNVQIARLGPVSR